VEVNSLAQIYAAKYLALENVVQVAEDLFNIMEVSIKTDSVSKQESTKDFLVRVIELINEVDADYADEIAKSYLDKTLDQYLNVVVKKDKK
jgi:translation elongation factor EF-Ts